VRTTGKLPLYLAADAYVLASDVGEAALVLPREMLVEYRGVVDRDYPAKLAERLRGLLADPDRLALKGANAARAREQFDYGVLVRRVRQVIEGVRRP
jgi:glycosyltransferase involved in cell wall biosynthesis